MKVPIYYIIIITGRCKNLTTVFFTHSGGARGLLLNHLTVHNGCEIIFDSSDAINHDKQDPSDFVKPSNDIDLKEFRDLFAVQMRGTDTSKLRICPEYANYRFSSHDAVETLDEVELAADTEAALIEDDGVHVDDEAFNLAFGGQGDINYDGCVWYYGKFQ